jgi:hypothetical protein
VIGARSDRTKRETCLQEVRPPATTGMGKGEGGAGAAPKNHPRGKGEKLFHRHPGQRGTRKIQHFEGHCRRQPDSQESGAGAKLECQIQARGNLDCVKPKPCPSLRVFGVAGGWSGRVAGRAVRRTWRKARSVGVTLGVSGSGVALALLAWTVAKTVTCRGRKRGNPSPGQRGSRFPSVQGACGGFFSALAVFCI